MSLQKSNIETVDKYLGGQYFIPNYQRDYSWENDELSDFWEDLIYLVDHNAEGSHFFGQVVVHNDEENKKKYIIDGQQRTITSMIFLKAMQNKYSQLQNNYGLDGAKRKYSIIETNYLSKFYDETGNYNLTLGSKEDVQFYTDYIMNGEPEDCPKRNKRRAHTRLGNAYSFFSSKIDGYWSRNGNADSEDEPQRKLDDLNRLFVAFTNQFHVLLMEVSELSEAFIIFETLNARGRDLETSDLLKNYLFSKSGDISKSQNQWLTMIDKLGSADTAKYVRHYWNSRHDFARDKALYRCISQHADTQQKCDRLMGDLCDLSPYYHDMSNPQDEPIGYDDDKILRSLENLKLLRASTYYPILLSLKSADIYSNKDVAAILKTIESYVFRNLTICNNTANSTETFFAEVAKDIFDGAITTTEEIINKISEKIIDDETFSITFKNWTAKPSDKDVVRYILRNIHYYIEEKTPKGGHEIILDNNDVHIEHIMPVEASRYWSDVDEDSHEQLLWRLGNLALLGELKNKSALNRPFSEKKIIYAESKIEPNSDLAKYDTWGKEQIEERQELFAKYALEIWKKQK